MARRARYGFTIIELIVVILVISLLIILFTPRVSGPHGISWRQECRNNTIQLAICLILFEEHQGAFPAYCSKLSDMDVSWVVATFPYMEQNVLHREWSNPAVEPKPTSFIPLLHCPSDRLADYSTNDPLLSYLVNTRVCSREDDGDHGLAYSEIADGAAHTLLLSEGLRDSVPSGRRWTMTDQRYIGFRGEDNAGRPVALSDELSSNHDGGVHVMFADGHAHFLSDAIEDEVYKQLCDPRDNQ